MTAAPQSASRFVLAPVVDGVAAWTQGTDVVLTPIRLAAPVPVALSYRQRLVCGVDR